MKLWPNFAPVQILGSKLNICAAVFRFAEIMSFDPNLHLLNATTGGDEGRCLRNPR